VLVYVYSVQIKSNPHELAGEIIVSQQGEFSPEERSLIARRLGIDWREELLIEPFPIGDNDSLLGPPTFTTANERKFWVYRPEERHAH
jgi:hypothetical protein